MTILIQVLAILFDVFLKGMDNSTNLRSFSFCNIYVENYTNSGIDIIEKLQFFTLLNKLLLSTKNAGEFEHFCKQMSYLPCLSKLICRTEVYNDETYKVILKYGKQFEKIRYLSIYGTGGVKALNILGFKEIIKNCVFKTIYSINY